MSILNYVTQCETIIFQVRCGFQVSGDECEGFGHCELRSLLDRTRTSILEVRNPLFSNMVIRYSRVGEETGTVEREKEVKKSLKELIENSKSERRYLGYILLGTNHQRSRTDRSSDELVLPVSHSAVQATAL